MSEIIEKNNTGEAGENAEKVEKTFSQEDVNRIVAERLNRERSTKAAELEEREKAVKARELAVKAAEKLAEAGLPKELNAVLKYDDEASLEAAISQLANIKGFKKEAEKEEKYIPVENKGLPQSQSIPEEDPIKKAFAYRERY